MFTSEHKVDLESYVFFLLHDSLFFIPLYP